MCIGPVNDCVKSYGFWHKNRIVLKIFYMTLYSKKACKAKTKTLVKMEHKNLLIYVLKIVHLQVLLPMESGPAINKWSLNFALDIIW